MLSSSFSPPYQALLRHRVVTKDCRVATSQWSKPSQCPSWTCPSLHVCCSRTPCCGCWPANSVPRHACLPARRLEQGGPSGFPAWWWIWSSEPLEGVDSTRAVGGEQCKFSWRILKEWKNNSCEVAFLGNSRTPSREGCFGPEEHCQTFWKHWRFPAITRLFPSRASKPHELNGGGACFNFPTAHHDKGLATGVHGDRCQLAREEYGSPNQRHRWGGDRTDLDCEWRSTLRSECVLDASSHVVPCSGSLALTLYCVSLGVEVRQSNNLWPWTTK